MNNFYVKCNFTDAQLDAMRSLYATYFESKMPKYYTGTGVAAFWSEGYVYPTAKDLSHDPATAVKGFVVEDARLDDLWEEFGELLPYMGKSATITKITPGAIMGAHVDRAWRPNAIYFPIADCTVDCVSNCYDENRNLVDSYSVYGNAYLTNVHVMHGVVNKSAKTRVAFGWNFKDASMSFEDCYRVLQRLGFING